MNSIKNVHSELEKLNDDWINNFEKNDKLYQDFYKDNVYYTNIDIIYINNENEIEKIKQESFLMSVENCITRDELIGLLKKNSIDNNKRYSLMSILKYNITLEDNDIKNFLLSTNSSDYNEHFLTINKHIDTIKFEKTINMFQDLNNIYFIFYEKSKNIEHYGNSNIITKKVYLTPSYKKKTIKK
jgi:hypothetical protein